ncbi:MAG: ferredoxin--NADP+ reductase [Planctomycetota bacterium]|jgi:ferredoxin--NADP+ reductase
MIKTLTNAIVAQRIEVSPGLIILRVVPEGWDLPDYEAGQFSVLGLPGSAKRCLVSEPDDEPVDPDKLIKRAYSIASTSQEKDFMEFYVSMVPSGALSPRLFALEPGDGVWLSPKATGMFTLSQVPEDKHVILISTGTGLAPFVSMLRSNVQCGGERQFTVLHGARHSWDLGYRSELMTMDRMCPNISYTPAVSRPADEVATWNGATGRIQEVWKHIEEYAGYAPTPENTHIFLCGNPSMIEGMVKGLELEGYREHKKKSPGQVHVERYW